MLGFKKIIYFMEKCIEICKKNKISLVSGMTTNGYLLTLDNFKKLLKCKVFLFQITLDGPREIHNKLRPHKNKQDSFEVIIDNLRKINFEIKQYYSIVLRINLTKATVNNFTKFMNELKFLKRNNKINFNCQKMSNYGGESINKLIDEMITEEDFANIHSTLVENNFNIINQPLIKAGAGLCSSCKKNSYYIDPDGNVLKCSLAIYNFKFKEKNIIGYIKEDGEIFIKNDIENQWIKRNKLDNECKHCKFYPICYNHYCPYRRMIKNKKYVTAIKTLYLIHYRKGEIMNINLKKEEIKKIFQNNGLLIENEILDLDSLSFLSLLVDLEEYLNIEIEEINELFELNKDEYTFNKIFNCIQEYYK